MGAQDDIAFYKLPSVLDLGTAEAFLGTIRQSLQAAPKLRLDADNVDVVTLPCAQIIMAALASGTEVKIQRPSQAFLDAFADLGLDVSAHLSLLGALLLFAASCALWPIGAALRIAVE